jgi:hypothetical protein
MSRTLHCNARSVLAVILFLVLNGCAAVGPQNSRNVSIVGLWEEQGDTVHALSLRKANGTYRRKVLQRYDYARPAIGYQEEGHWTVSGGQYVFTADHISALRWKKDVGKQRTLRILESNSKVFKYLSTDGAVVEERRIGEASDAMFEKSQLGNEIRDHFGD